MWWNLPKTYSTFKTLWKTVKANNYPTTTFQIQIIVTITKAFQILHPLILNGMSLWIIQFCPLLNGGKGHSEVSEVYSTRTSSFVWVSRGRSVNRSDVWWILRLGNPEYGARSDWLPLERNAIQAHQVKSLSMACIKKINFLLLSYRDCPLLEGWWRPHTFWSAKNKW